MKNIIKISAISIIVLLFSSCDLATESEESKELKAERTSLIANDLIKKNWKKDYKENFNDGGWSCGECISYYLNDGKEEKKFVYINTSDIKVDNFDISEDAIGYLLTSKIRFMPRLKEDCVSSDSKKGDHWTCSEMNVFIEVRYSQNGKLVDFITVDYLDS